MIVQVDVGVWACCLVLVCMLDINKTWTLSQENMEFVSLIPTKSSLSYLVMSFSYRRYEARTGER